MYGLLQNSTKLMHTFMECNMAVLNYIVILVTLCGISSGSTVIYNINETVTPYTYIGTIANSTNLRDLAGDDDFRNLKYTFLGTDNHILSLFRINEKTSRLDTAGPLDRESICEFTVICALKLAIAVQSTRTSFFMKIPVSININDVNDNAPVFYNPNITVSLSEASVIGQKLTIDGARDKDTSDTFSLQSYEVHPSNTPFSIEFEKKLDGTSIVRLKIDQALDRETHSSYMLEIVAKDGGQPPQSGTLQANIIITDVNDNPPEFLETQYKFNVKEDVLVNSIIGTIQARDLDEGDNGKVTYRLSQHQSDNILNMFTIDSATGELRVKQRLSYAPGKQYQIIVEASDMADQPLTSQTLTIVTVEDVGNSAPVIVVNHLSGTDVAHITEYANKGTAVAHIAVHDDDTGDNGNVYCTMQSDFFQLMLLGEKEYNVVVKEKLDREAIPSHNVSISCQDNGKPPFNVSSSFNIEIEDENDNSPKFPSIPYTETIFEGNKKGDVIVQVFAIDNDTGKNAQVHYFLDNEGSKLFNINHNTGVVRAAIELDREVTPTITATIFGIDQGSPAMTGSTQLTVQILDLNDNPPIFIEQVFEMEVLENKPSGIEVGQLQASDRDEGDNGEIVFSLPEGTPIDLPFLILPHGQITTNKVLDRERQSSFGFYVIAYDLGYPAKTSTASVVVNILDMNDHRPEIKGPNYANNTFSISSTSKAGKIISTVVAFDKDEGDNSDLYFELLNKDALTLFSIHEKTGAISLLRDINVKPGSSFSLEIQVSDNGMYPQKSFITLTVVIGIGEPKTETSSTNIVIVIVLVSLTLVASTVIIAVIVFLRRVDRNAKSSKSKSKGGYYSGGTVIDPSVTVFSLPDDSILFSEKKKKKEVSFSIDDDSDQIDALQLPSKTSHPLDKMFVEKEKRLGDDNRSIGSASDSGHGNSDDEANRSPHPSGTKRPQRGSNKGSSEIFSPRKITHSQPLLYSPSKMIEQQSSRPLNFHTDNPRNIFHFEHEEPVMDCVV